MKTKEKASALALLRANKEKAFKRLVAVCRKAELLYSTISKGNVKISVNKKSHQITHNGGETLESIIKIVLIEQVVWLSQIKGITTTIIVPPRSIEPPHSKGGGIVFRGIQGDIFCELRYKGELIEKALRAVEDYFFSFEERETKLLTTYSNE